MKQDKNHLMMIYIHKDRNIYSSQERIVKCIDGNDELIMSLPYHYLQIYATPGLTAYQHGVSCLDAMFSAYETLTRNGNTVFQTFYDLEKATWT